MFTSYNEDGHMHVHVNPILKQCLVSSQSEEFCNCVTIAEFSAYPGVPHAVSDAIRHRVEGKAQVNVHASASLPL